MRGFRPIKLQLWREMAHFEGALIAGNDSADGLCKSAYVDGPSSNRSFLHCQYRYPSPRRSGPFGSRPTPLFAGLLVELRRLSRLAQKTLVLWRQTADSSANKPTQNSMQNKGSTLCSISVFFSPLWLSRLFRRASTMTSSAASRVRPLVLSSQAPRVATPSLVRLLVAPQARCVTNSLVSAAKANTPLFGASIQYDRRSGIPLSGGFAF